MAAVLPPALCREHEKEHAEEEVLQSKSDARVLVYYNILIRVYKEEESYSKQQRRMRGRRRG
jgi:hypothetical protein